MKKTYITYIAAITLILIGFNPALSTNITNKEKTLKILETEVIYIDKNNTMGPWDGSYDHPYQNISEGVSATKNGDIIIVLEGVYHEQLIIDKTITIIGENKEKTIIDAEYKEYGIKIKADNVQIEVLTIRNTGGYEGYSGIITESKNNKILDCIIKRTRTGIFLNNTENNKIENCTLYLNGEGIYTKSSKNLEIKNNEFCYSGIGINSRNSSNILIKNCYIHESGTGLFFNITSNVDLIDIALCDNNDNGGGCFIYNSNSFNFLNCNIFHNGCGLVTVNSSNLNLKNCNIENITHFAVRIQEKTENISITDCNIVNNFRHGINMVDSSCNVCSSNLFNNQIDSVKVEDSLCNAKNNYWGSKFGPLFNHGFRIIDIFSFHFRRIKYFPWSKNPYEEAGSDWIVEDRYTKTIVKGYEDLPIKLAGNDTDYDGIPNWWEEEFNYDASVWNDHQNLDPDGDALNNFEECYAYEWGAHPYKKDIFLEVDHTSSKTPDASNILPEKYVEKMKEKFEEHDITLHVDQGMLDGGEEIPYITDFNFDKLVDLYWDYFLHNDLNNPRKNIFHYGLICDQGPGSGFAFIGWGHLNGFCISAEYLSNQHQFIDRGKLITHGSMHETGHTLGLVVDDFGGNDNHAAMCPKYPEFYYYRNYKSCMNYRYTYYILDYSDGNNGKVDYNDWDGMEFDFFKNTHFEWPKT